jgi:RNA polymerase sigma-70 factor (ECF subfamily)
MQPIAAPLCYSGVYMATPVSDDLCARLATDLDGHFTELVMEHQHLVFGVALRVVRDAAAAEDVAQEVFVRAYRAMRRYPEERVRELRLRPWLGRMTLNLARNAIRGRRQHVDVDDVAEMETRSEEGPLQLLQRSEEQRMWARLLTALPERYRLAVALRHVDGLSYAELAETLGKPLGSVKSDVHRGIDLLRAAYEAENRLVAAKEAV